MEYGWRCKYCGHQESWDAEAAAKAAGVWHIYDEHRELWDATKPEGWDGPPPIPRPEILGRKYEDWESQL